MPESSAGEPAAGSQFGDVHPFGEAPTGEGERRAPPAQQEVAAEAADDIRDFSGFPHEPTQAGMRAFCEAHGIEVHDAQGKAGRGFKQLAHCNASVRARVILRSRSLGIKLEAKWALRFQQNHRF